MRVLPTECIKKLCPVFVNGNGSEYVLALNTGIHEGYIHIGTITGKCPGDSPLHSPQAPILCHVSSGEVAGSGLSFCVYGNGDAGCHA